MEDLRALIPDYARDIRLNLETVLAPEGLTPHQALGVALACAYALEAPELVQALSADEAVDSTVQEAARAAATIMAMNNVYYRAIHLLGDSEMKAMPARLRMNIIGRPGIPKVDFELMSFAVSALAGCGQCLTSHLHELRKHGVSDAGSQGALKIASVLQAAARALRIRDLAG